MTQMICEKPGKKLFLLCADKHAPLRNKRVRPCQSPWITSQLKKRLHARDILKLKATRSGDADDRRNHVQKTSQYGKQ